MSKPPNQLGCQGLKGHDLFGIALKIFLLSNAEKMVNG